MLRLLALHAHPDDESSKGAASVAKYVDAGVRAVLVTATGGEAGDILNPAMDLPEVKRDLAAVRRAELEEAAAIIGYLGRSLPEGGARQIIDLGIAVESALGTVRLLRSLAVEAHAINETGPMVLDLINSTTGFVEGVEPGSQVAVFQVALLAQANPCSVRNLLMRIESSLRAMPAARDREQALESTVANKLVELGVLDLGGMLGTVDGPQHMDQLLQDLHEWLRTLAVGIEKRYTPRRPARSSQLVLTA